MKHFRKPLVALLILAMLLITAVVTVIAADDQSQAPAGNMLDASALLDAAVAEEDLAKKNEAELIIAKNLRKFNRILIKR